MHDDPVFQTREAARYLGVGRTKFFQMIKEKRLPDPVRYSARKIGYRRSTLDAFIRSCEATS